MGTGPKTVQAQDQDGVKAKVKEQEEEQELNLIWTKLMIYSKRVLYYLRCWELDCLFG